MLEAFVVSAVGGVIRTVLGYLKAIRLKTAPDFNIEELFKSVILSVVTGAPVILALNADPQTGLIVGYATGSVANKAWQIIAGEGGK